MNKMSKPYLDELRDQNEGSVKKAILVVVIVAVILLVIFVFYPMIIQMIFGQQNPNPSDRF